MQQTRLNTIVDALIEKIERLFNNPWRRFALIVISLLFGFFMGSAIITTAGQYAQWDVIGAGMLILFIEIANRLVYGRKHSVGQQNLTSRVGQDRSMGRSLLLDILHAFKVGLTYSLFLEAFKLGS